VGAGERGENRPRCSQHARTEGQRGTPWAPAVRFAPGPGEDTLVTGHARPHGGRELGGKGVGSGSAEVERDVEGFYDVWDRRANAADQPSARRGGAPTLCEAARYFMLPIWRISSVAKC
jgi:hypothetical protein